MKTLLRKCLGCWIVLLLGSPLFVMAQAARPMIDTPHVDVEVWGMTIATVRAQYHGRSPQERAERTADLIRSIQTADSYAIKIIPADDGNYHGVWFEVNGKQSFGLLKGDEPGHLTFDEYVLEVEKRLQQWLKRRDAQKNPELVLHALLYSLLATLVFAGAVYLLARGRKTLLLLLEQRGKQKNLQVGGIQLLPYFLMLLSGIVRIFMFLLIALFSYLWLMYVLYQFPYTNSTAENLSSYIVSILGHISSAILESIPDLLMVGVVFWFAGIASGAINNVFRRIESGRLRTEMFDQETAKATRRVFVVLVWLFAVVIAYPYIPGSGTEAFKGVSVFVGLMISLGSAGIVSQLLGGLIVVYTRAFQPGEYVKIADIEGVVSTVGVLSTKIKTVRNEEITIPNAVLLNATSTNISRLSKGTGVHVSTSVTIGYDTPWPQVHYLLLTGAARTEGLRATPEPVVRQTGLSDFYVEYKLIAHIDDPMQKVKILSDLHQNIQDAFAEAGVQIMSPHFEGQPENNVLPGEWTPPAKTENAIAAAGGENTKG